MARGYFQCSIFIAHFTVWNARFFALGEILDVGIHSLGDLHLFWRPKVLAKIATITNLGARNLFAAKSQKKFFSLQPSFFKRRKKGLSCKEIIWMTFQKKRCYCCGRHRLLISSRFGRVFSNVFFWSGKSGENKIEDDKNWCSLSKIRDCSQSAVFVFSRFFTVNKLDRQKDEVWLYTWKKFLWKVENAKGERRTKETFFFSIFLSILKFGRKFAEKVAVSSPVKKADYSWPEEEMTKVDESRKRVMPNKSGNFSLRMEKIILLPQPNVTDK